MTKCTEAGKSIRLPSLDRQLTGTLVQYKFPWNQWMQDADSCPCCQHSLRMAVESQSQAGVNAKNSELQTKASAGGGDSKFKALLALHGCYCCSNNCRGDQGGYGCVCVTETSARDGYLQY